MMVVVLLLAVIMVLLVALVAALSAIAINGQRRTQLPPRPPEHWQGYQGPAGPIYPAYNPAQYLSPDDRERVMILIRGGKKIQAIKLYREATGAGLAEAKAAVEQLERYR